MNELLYEPLKYYEDYAKATHQENVLNFFDSLKNQASIDEELNRATVKKYQLALEDVTNQKKQVRKYKTLKVLTIIMAIILAPLLGLGIFLGIYLLKKKINPKLEENKKKLQELEKIAEELLNMAYEQVRALKSLFNNQDTLRLIEKTMPEIKFDKCFSVERYARMKNDFDYNRCDEDNISVQDTLSGELLGNPFLFTRRLRMDMIETRYTGSITIHWTETHYNSEGELEEEEHSEILTAYVDKPKPYYNLTTELGYGHEAAPDLRFTRIPAHNEDLSERERTKKVKKGSKKLKKKAEESLLNGGKFQKMDNDEFDVFFGAHDRNNELQFRLLYTPLGQKNTLELVLNEDGYGDDFAFEKRHKYNVIKSEHAQNWWMDFPNELFKAYDIDKIRQSYVWYNNEFFRSIFFDFAPIMAIPAYLEETKHYKEELKDIPFNYTEEEQEVLANMIGANYFKPENADTQTILKTTIIDRLNHIDNVAVTAYAYIAEERISYIAVHGGDGYYHDVPVPWIEYIPVEKTTNMVLFQLDISEEDFKRAASNIPNLVYYHGIVAYPADLNMDIQEVFKEYIKK